MLPSNATTNCSSGPYEVQVFLVSQGVVALVGVLTCLTAIIMVVVLKLYKLLVYRLAIYQVISALALVLTCILDVVKFLLSTYQQNKAQSRSFTICLAIAYISTYTLLVKLFLTVIITFHLFVFAVCYKNLKKLEVCYVVSSLVFPAIMATIPFITRTYGEQSKGSPWCWIQQNDDNCPPQTIVAGLVEAFVLWYGPALCSLLAVSSLVVVMLSVMAYRMRTKSTDVLIYRTALKQLLPLMVYPITFCLLVLAAMVEYVYSATPGSHTYSKVFSIIEGIAFQSISWTAGLALLVHIMLMMWSKKRTRRDAVIPSNTANSGLLRTAARSSTYFSFPSESVNQLHY